MCVENGAQWSLIDVVTAASGIASVCVLPVSPLSLERRHILLRHETLNQDGGGHRPAMACALGPSKPGGPTDGRWGSTRGREWRQRQHGLKSHTPVRAKSGVCLFTCWFVVSTIIHVQACDVKCTSMLTIETTTARKWGSRPTQTVFCW